tara:strand:+ start:23572 stop:24732 length:1161 start_codon:yes stop_codon:yes gene_type:complete
MSNLLERAIIDAQALKEAALKNAEQLVIEKYSTEVKDAVNRLLEEEEELSFEDDTMMATDPMAEDPLATATGEEADLTGDEIPEFDVDSVVADMPDAFMSDDDEIIRIKLDSLEADIEEDEDIDSAFASGEEMADDEIGIDIADDEPTADVTDIETAPSFDNTPDAGVDIDITPAMVAEALKEMDIDEEIDLEEVMEAVRVDFEPQKSGWAGTPESIMREYEQMLLAREQDDKVKEENEELRKTVAALQKENKTLTSAATKLQAQVEKYTTAFETLHEKLDTLNVSNAKLLYINQALENASLNERQKEKVVEAISKAETVQEAKIVFETLNDTVATSSVDKKESTLSEMVSRKSTLLVAARNEQKTTKDANPLFNRMQRLAGIKTE